MAATYDWQEDNGAATGSPSKGTTRTTGRAEANWKNIDDSTTAYTAQPIVAGNNSYQKPMFGKFTGTYNQILNGLFAHTAGAMGTGLTIKGIKAITADTDRWLYTTPATSADANLSIDHTSVIAIGSGIAIWFGATGPEATGKAASVTVNPAYTVFLTHQLQTTGSAAAGDTATATFTLQYDENIFAWIGLGLSALASLWSMFHSGIALLA